MSRRGRSMPWVAVGVVAAFALGGCVGEEEPEPSTPTPTATHEPPDPDALLAEARGVYEGFLAASNAMWSEPDVDYTTFLEWANDEVATNEAAAHESLRADGVADIGPVVLSAFELADSPSAEEVDVWLCLDFSDSVRLDAEGDDVTPADAITFVPLQVRFEPRSDEGLILTMQEALPNGVESPCP